MFTLRSAIRPFDVIISATIPHLLPPLTRSLRKTKSIGPDQYYAWWPPNPQQHPNISRDPRGDGFDVSLRPLGLPGDRSIMELIPDLPRNNGQRYLIFPEHRNPSQIYLFPLSIFCWYYICHCKVFSRSWGGLSNRFPCSPLFREIRPKIILERGTWKLVMKSEDQSKSSSSLSLGHLA